MFETQAKYMLSNWGGHERKIFKYIRHPMPTEYIVLSKDYAVMPDNNGDFKNTLVFISHEKSTFILPKLTEADIIRMMMRGELEYEREYNEYVDVTRHKTGGCDCGAWIIGLDEAFYQHSTWCSLYRNPHEKRNT